MTFSWIDRRAGARIAVLCLVAAGLADCGRHHEPIRVTAATYGASCGLPAGNVTKAVKTACDGKRECDYAVDYHVIGDPAVGCRKDFSVTWACGAAAGGTATAPAEAGYGSIVHLRCGD